MLRMQDKRANSVDPDEIVHYELPHLDLGCMQSQLISFFTPMTLQMSRFDHLLIFNRIAVGKLHLNLGIYMSAASEDRCWNYIIHIQSIFSSFILHV